VRAVRTDAGLRTDGSLPAPTRELAPGTPCPGPAASCSWCGNARCVATRRCRRR